MKAITILLDYLYPPKCVLCQKILEKNELDLCTDCRKSAPVFPTCKENMHPDGKRKLLFLDSFTAVWYYDKKVRSSILRYKFYQAQHYARAYGRLLAMKILQEYECDFDFVTWVPVSRLRKWSRGYDQSELLARCTAKELGIPVKRFLRKIRNNPRQSSLSPEQRKVNVLGVYQAENEADIRDHKLLLVDDIFTTGATAEECARVLLTAGAKQIRIGCVAASQKQSNIQAGE